MRAGYISRDVFRRLFLLCLIAAFDDGIYGALRLQKVAYAIERDTLNKPFEFRHAPYGQYSEDLEDLKEQLLSMGYITATPIGASDRGNRYVLTDRNTKEYFCGLLEKFDQELNGKIAEVIGEIGYLEEKELRRHAYTFEEFINSELNDILVESNLPDVLKTEALSQDDCEELELTLSSTFITGMNKVLQGLEDSEIEWDKVGKIVPKL